MQRVAAPQVEDGWEAVAVETVVRPVTVVVQKADCLAVSVAAAAQKAGCLVGVAVMGSSQ